jgi:hypothetical protein
MASPQCMSNDGRTATFVGTMLDTGDGVTLCDECLVMYCAAILQTMTGVDPTPFLQAISDDEPIPYEIAGDGGEGPPPPGPADPDLPSGVPEPGDEAPDPPGEPPPKPVAMTPRSGRTRPKRSSAVAATGTASDDE